MASKVRIEMHPHAVGQVLRGEGGDNRLLEELERRANAMANAAGDGMDVDVRVGRTRARASVRTGTPEAMRAEARDKTLTRAIDAGRG